MSDEDCKHCDQMLTERDDAQEWADELASRLATIIGADIGEHSNLNCPYEEACSYADAVINGKTGCGVWNPIDCAPKDGTHVLVRDAAAPQQPPTTAHWFDGGWHLSVNALGEHSDHGMKSVTHWMQLPPTD